MAVSVERDLIVDLTRDLVRYPSVNPPGDEQEIAEYLGRRMEELGLEVEGVQISSKGANDSRQASGKRASSQFQKPMFLRSRK